jgi:hypothetical protein
VPEAVVSDAAAPDAAVPDAAAPDAAAPDAAAFAQVVDILQKLTDEAKSLRIAAEFNRHCVEGSALDVVAKGNAEYLVATGREFETEVSRALVTMQGMQQPGGAQQAGEAEQRDEAMADVQGAE